MWVNKQSCKLNHCHAFCIFFFYNKVLKIIKDIENNQVR